mmetsp:Transcript_16330/g.36577  ORF Transcript_16330/g.36577 Transcript_16330/m.36577 type:complete len:189 (+) Transcript_16330:181-747(+)
MDHATHHGGGAVKHGQTLLLAPTHQSEMGLKLWQLKGQEPGHRSVGQASGIMDCGEEDGDKGLLLGTEGGWGGVSVADWVKPAALAPAASTSSMCAPLSLHVPTTCTAASFPAATATHLNVSSAQICMHEHPSGVAAAMQPNAAEHKLIRTTGVAERLIAGDDARTNARTSPVASVAAAPTKRKRRFW